MLQKYLVATSLALTSLGAIASSYNPHAIPDYRNYTLAKLEAEYRNNTYTRSFYQEYLTKKFTSFKKKHANKDLSPTDFLRLVSLEFFPQLNKNLEITYGITDNINTTYVYLPGTELTNLVKLSELCLSLYEQRSKLVYDYSFGNACELTADLYYVFNYNPDFLQTMALVSTKGELSKVKNKRSLSSSQQQLVKTNLDMLGYKFRFSFLNTDSYFHENLIDFIKRVYDVNIIVEQ